MERKYMKNRFTNPIFFDSGAHGLYEEHIAGKGHKYGYSWYATKDFTEYLDSYAAFLKENPKIKTYANVDVIFNPQLTWKSQQYLEKEHGLSPIPVIHSGTDKKWLLKYLDEGYDYIALGGLGQESQLHYINWADNMFDIICDTPDRKPCVKNHGFAVTSFPLMRRYPWFSVDSTTWMTSAIYGQVIIPALKNNQWDYTNPFHIIRLSNKTSKKSKPTKGVIQIVERYFKEKGFIYGSSDEKTGEVIVKGLINDIEIRAHLNAMYFIDFCDHLPKWPWSFHRNHKKLIDL